MIDLQKIYIQGLQKKQEQRKTTTNYRGGNTGVQVTDDLHNAGSPNTCQRVIIARANGRETEPDWRTNLMFDAGHMNEIRWREYFELAGYKIKDGKQLEGLIKWETSNGKTVTGSPDAIVTDKKGRGIKEYIVSGHCCESGDILTPAPGDPESLKPRRLLEARVGDLIVIEGAGAYCSSMSTIGYNSFPQAAEVLITGDENIKPELIRKRGSLEQLMQNEVSLE